MILIDILEEHIEEADFLWQQRKNALSDRAYNLGDLAELEERLFAHLDGLALGGNDAWKLLEPKLSSGEEGEVFTAAFVALDSNDSSMIDLVQKNFSDAEGNVINGICYAFKHTMNPDVENILLPLLNSDNVCNLAAIIDSLSFRRVPIDADKLQTFLHNKDPRIVTATLRAVGRLRIRQFLEEAERLLDNEVIEVRREAVKTGLLLGSRKALDVCRSMVASCIEGADQFIEYPGLMGMADDVNILMTALKNPILVRNAVKALGLTGNISTIELLIQCASEPKLSRLAGESFRRITGVNLEKGKLISEKLQEPKTSSLPEEEFEMDPDEDLPFPDHEKLTEWWRSNSAKFDKRVRYRNGQPYSYEVLIDILKNGILPYRHYAAFELALMNPAYSYLETHAFSIRQRRDMKF